MTRPAATLLRLWLAASGIGLAVAAVWAFAPVVLFVLLLTAGLGVVAVLMIAIARRLESWRSRRAGTHES